jgi:hypothetical protein
MTTMHDYRWLRVTIDGEPDLTFEALVDPAVRWNGFLCPLLPRDEADRLAATSNETAAKDPEACDKLTYDPVADGYIQDRSVTYPDDPAETITAVHVDGVPFYPIGAHGWVWSEAKDRTYLMSEAMSEAATLSYIGPNAERSALIIERVLTIANQKRGPSVPSAGDDVMFCAGCLRPAYVDHRDERPHHALRAKRGCSLIPAEDRPDDRCHPLVGGRPGVTRVGRLGQTPTRGSHGLSPLE